VIGAEPRLLAPGILSTGMLDSQPPEQGMVIDAGGVTAAISGCAHPGMERICERAMGLLGRPIDWAIGGFHLMDAGAAEIDRSIRSLQSLGVAQVVPTHCTGDAAKAESLKAQLKTTHQENIAQRKQDKSELKTAKKELRTDRKEALKGRADRNKDGKVDAAEKAKAKETAKKKGWWGR
jgi:hypothetical protein